MVKQFLELALENSVRSSANKICEILGPDLLMLIGHQSLSCTTSSISLKSLDTHYEEVGDKGSPCLMPLVDLK